MAEGSGNMLSTWGEDYWSTMVHDLLEPVWFKLWLYPKHSVLLHTQKRSPTAHATLQSFSLLIHFVGEGRLLLAYEKHTLGCMYYGELSYDTSSFSSYFTCGDVCKCLKLELDVVLWWVVQGTERLPPCCPWKLASISLSLPLYM